MAKVGGGMRGCLIRLGELLMRPDWTAQALAISHWVDTFRTVSKIVNIIDNIENV